MDASELDEEETEEMEKNRERKRMNGAKNPLRRRLSATSRLKLGSVRDGVVADFADEAKKLKRQEEDNEDKLVVAREEEEGNGQQTGVPGADHEDDTVEKSGRGEMGDGSEGEEATQPLKRVDKTHNHGKISDDCSPVDPATVPRKLRSAMNKRNRESISPPMPELKKLNASNGSKVTPVAHLNGVKKSKQGLKQANAADRSVKKAASMAVTKTEEEVAEALYDLSRIITNRSLTSQTDTKIEGAKLFSLPEERAASSNKNPEICEAAGDDMSRSSGEVQTSLLTDGFPYVEKLDLECNARTDLRNNLLFKEDSSASPLTDVSNTLVPPCGLVNADKGITPMAILDLLPLREAEKGDLQPEIVAAQKEEPSKENSDKSASIGNSGGACPVLRHSNRMTNGSYSPLDLSRPVSNKASTPQENTIDGTKSCFHLDLSEPPSTKIETWQDSNANVTVSASTGKPLDQRKPSWKRCAAHVHLSHFIHGRKNVGKAPRWATQTSQPPELTEVAKAAGGCSIYKDSSSSTLTADSTAGRNPQVACQQLLQEKMPVQGHGCSQEAQGIDFSSLSSGGGDGANYRKLSSEKSVEHTGPLNSSFVQSAQHQSVLPFSIQAARLPTSYTGQQLSAPGAAQQAQVQLQMQMQMPQYLANPFLNPHFAAAAVAVAGATTPAGKQQQQQLWASQMTQYHQSTQFPKWENGRSDTASLLPCSQSGSLVDRMNSAYAHSPQLFPVASSRNKNPQQLQRQFFCTDALSQLQLLSNGDRM